MPRNVVAGHVCDGGTLTAETVASSRFSFGDTSAAAMPDEDQIAAILASDEAFECQECHWEGRSYDLLRVLNDDGSVALVCPNCEQDRWLFPA